MLTMFRKLMNGPGKYVFMALIIAAFGVVGVPALSNFGRGKAVEVGNQGFTAQQVEQEFARRYQLLQDQSDVGVTREEAIEQGLLSESIGSLVRNALVREEADRLGMAVTTSMIQDYIRNDEIFQNEDGEFDSSRVNRFIAINGLSVEEFRDIVRVDLLRDQLNDGLLLGQPAPETLTSKLVLRQTEERDTAIAVLTAANLPEPDEAALRAYYEANPTKYQSPEYRTYTLLRLNEDDVRARVTVDEEQVRQLYDARATQLGSPETRSFTQGQFGTIDAAHEALSAIEAGTPFREAVTANGGTLASFTDEPQRALADDTVAEAVFGSEEAGVVGPVDGVFGVVIADITSITPEVVVTFEEARPGLETELAEEVFNSEIDAVYDEIQEAGDTGASLAAAALDLDLNAETIGPITSNGMTPSGQTVEIESAVQRTAFSMQQDGFFEDIQLGDGGYAFIQIDDITEAKLKPYEEVAAQVALDAADANRTKALNELVDDVRQAVAGGKSFEEAVTEVGGVAATRTISIAAPPPDLPSALVEDIFFRASGDVLSSLGGGNSSVTIAQVQAVRYGPNVQAANMIARYEVQFGQELSRDLYDAYMRTLEADAGVKTNQALLDQRFGATQ
ncbi:SurA N-terminal domain-containing protein [Parvularcula marina]|uniref:peptidylprolyl isomerase n=2 Tax=Parvularcula marina TaxID=2292771 RepID=UPI003513C8C2